MRALVVDDNPTFRTQTARYLGLHDIDVDLAGCGAEALHALRSRPYDVVLLDLKMPDMQGLDVLRQAKVEGIHAPFIMVTGYGDVSSAVEAMKTGAVDFIEKPFDPERLLALVQETAASYRKAPWGEARLQALLVSQNADRAVLLIAEQPLQVEQSLSFTADEHLPLGGDDVSLADLREAIAVFLKGRDNAFIVHADIRYLFERHDADVVKRYLSYLHRCADAAGVTVLVLYDTSMEQEIMDRVVDHTDVALFVEDVIATLDHPIRRNILHLLEQNDVLPYSFFLKHMGIDYSAKLAFHLNRLQDDDLVEKTTEGYTLTERGRSFATMHRTLLLQRHHDTGNNVLYYLLPRKNYEAGGGI